MLWYNELIDRMSKEKTYCHAELINELKELKPDYADSTYNWAITGLIKNGTLMRQGYDAYTLPPTVCKKEYTPDYSDLAAELIQAIPEKYPYVSFTVLETVLMNEFLNHLIAQNTVFIQVEKESSAYIFRFLQEYGFNNVMYRPDKKDFNLYWSKDCIIVTDMISESPLRTGVPHSIMLEKMLVDVLADKLIASTYSNAEFPDMMKRAQEQYFLDKVRMLRYARRRNREEILKGYFEGSTILNAAE